MPECQPCNRVLFLPMAPGFVMFRQSVSNGFIFKADLLKHADEKHYKNEEKENPIKEVIFNQEINNPAISCFTLIN